MKSTTDRSKRSTILYLVTEDWYFCSHRLPIARAARDAGFDVIVATRVQSHAEEITRENFRLIPLSWRRRSLHPWNETRALIELVRVYRRERPDLVHHIALKPAVYGSISARLTRGPAVVNTVAGLGYVFTSRQWKARMLSLPLKLAFRTLLKGPNGRLILQNPDDREALSRYCNIRPEQTVLIRGSGVDLERFVPVSEPEGVPNVTMVSRMLWDKGVGELVEAARRLRESGDRVKFTLVGSPDAENPASVPKSQLEAWQDEGLVEYLGYRSDIDEVWANSTIAVLPTSYGEGVPKALMEAAASARPIIATDVPGCREIVKHEETGLLIPAKDTSALVNAIRRLLRDPDLRGTMGQKGRLHVADGFSEETVVKETMGVYETLLAGRKT